MTVMYLLFWLTAGLLPQPSLANETQQIDTLAVLGVSKTVDTDSSREIEHSAACCRVCTTGKACGDSCISRSLTCRKGAGCACNAGSTTSTPPVITTPVITTPTSPSPPSARPGGQAITPVFSTRVTAYDSFLRVWNDNGASKTVTITILDGATGIKLGSWSVSAPTNSSIQYAVSQMERGSVPPITGNTRPTYYTLYIDAGTDTAISSTKLQSVVWNSATGYFENISGCGSITDMHSVGNVHSSSVTQYPSTLYVYNDKNAPRNLTMDVYDAANGRYIGTYTHQTTLPAFASASVTAKQLEQAIFFTPASSQPHLNVRVSLEAADDDGNTSSPYRVKHIVQNGPTSAIADMTNFCSAIVYGTGQ